ncbi:hypothetical protein [Halococcus thailandensis]|uniref:hypothetical protein n=1 Tax=Halococcus thailandensis TaxID=335952 RepID=UPI0019D32F6D|nr:hypothetical protein [Halococcus thailandensis]
MPIESRAGCGKKGWRDVAAETYYVVIQQFNISIINTGSGDGDVFGRMTGE